MPAKNRNKSLFRYIWYIILIGNFIAIALLFGSVSAWYISPEKTNLFAYLGMGFPFVLVLNIIFLGFWILFLKWKYATISLVALLVCIKPILTYFPVHSRTKEVPEEAIKFLSYNVRVFNWDTSKDKAANPIYQYIKNSGADIVCIQEYMSANKGSIATDSEIKKILEHYPYSSVTRIREKEKTINYGLACFSKFPILETQKIPITSSDNGAVMYKIKVNDKIISVFNNHLESNRITAEDKKLYRDFLRQDNTRNMLDTVAYNIKNRLGIAYNIRSTQADTIAAWIERQDTDGVIVCGDFNDTPISYTYHKIKGDLSDAYAKTGFGPGITYHENHFWFRIDYIMYSDNMKSYNCTVDRVKYSDHYPIWTYLEIK